MPQAPRQTRRSESAPSRKSRPTLRGLLLDAVFLLLVGLAVAGAWFWWDGSVWWLQETLGLGWVPVGSWSVATLVLLRHWPRVLFRFWRAWVSSAALVAISVGSLSYFFAPSGVMSEVSYGGLWGSQVGGYPMYLGIAKLAGIAVATPLLIYPKWTGMKYFAWVSWTAVHLWTGLKSVSTHSYRGVRSLLNPRLMRERNRRMAGAVVQEFSAEPGWKGASHRAASPWDDLVDMENPLLEVTSEEPGSSVLASPEAVNGVGSGASPSQWRLPSRGLLAAPETYAAPQASLEQMARHIEGTLSEHGVMVECSDIQAGPRIVRFGLVPGWVAKRGDSRSKGGAEGSGERSRVKVQSVLTREKDLALALRTPYLRIEPAVPGEGFIGLEVPNPSPGKVPLRNVMDGPPFAAVAARGGLPIALGEDAGGAPVVLDLAALPHALIAGATGSGKSVCINSIVASLLFTKPPDQLRMLMVDPKRVELTPFNGIPHLIAPVITEGEEVNPALRGVMREMFRRYKLMEEVGARNIGGYNAKGREAMPFLVVVVDELADLMMVGGFEVEQNLVRLAQLGRATGIHLVLATQRPSVNVVTGLLKANIPARVAFAVASQVDSRVILDGVGAEKLLGKGDMLLLSHESPKPRRVQGTLVLDEEVDQVVEFWQREKGPPLPVISIEDGEEEEEVVQVDRDLLEQARELALHHPNLSPSLLQRRLNIGELKAREILEVLEEESRVFPS